MRVMRVRSALLAATAGLLAGGVALGAAELIAGLVPGAPSPVTEIGALLIAFQPRGAEQFVISVLGKADKPVLTIAVAIGGLLLSAGLGLVARYGTRLTWGLALAGFGALGLLALVAAFRDPLVDPILAMGVFALSLGITWWVLSRLLRIAAAYEERQAPTAEMPDWSRRRFIGNSLTFGVAALASGAIGRTLLEVRAREAASVEAPPAAIETVPPLPASASLNVPGITPLVVPNDDFYRIDTTRELLGLLSAFTDQYRADKLTPLLHLETHGNEDGIGTDAETEKSAPVEFSSTLMVLSLLLPMLLTVTKSGASSPSRSMAGRAPSPLPSLSAPSIIRSE